jgi:hypothetical protein
MINHHAWKPAAETCLQRRHNSAEEGLTMVKKGTEKELKDYERCSKTGNHYL